MATRPTAGLSMKSGADAAPLGIIAGGGALPAAVADAVMATGRDVFIVGIEGLSGPDIDRFPHGRVHLGKLGQLFGRLRDAGCIDVVIIGRADRPDFTALRLDGTALRSLPRIMSIMVGGDDAVLGGVIKFIEEHGFRVVGAHDVAPGLLAGAGVLGRYRPKSAHDADIALGRKAIALAGALDIGQAAVVYRERIVALEAAEGTDAMIERVGALRQNGRMRAKGRAGVLIKLPKPGQDLRVDMPTIGPHTVDLAAKSELTGIAIAAGQVLMVDRIEMIRRADAAGLFLVGITV